MYNFEAIQSTKVINAIENPITVFFVSIEFVPILSSHSGASFTHGTAITR